VSLVIVGNQPRDCRSQVVEVARAFEANPNVLHLWRCEFRWGPRNAFPGTGKERWGESRVAQLERKTGQQALEIFCEGLVAAHRGAAAVADAFSQVLAAP
jgi:transposase-like protein